MKKMVLLEQAEVDRLRQRQIRDYDPNLSAMARAQTQLEAILADHDMLSDEDKLSLIDQLSQKFTKLKKTAGPLDQQSPAAAAPDSSISPKDYNVLMTLILNNPDIVSSDAKGQMVLNRKSMRGTNLEEIVKGVIKGEKIKGAEAFLQAIKSLRPIKNMFSSPSLISTLFPQRGKGLTPPGTRPKILYLYN